MLVDRGALLVNASGLLGIVAKSWLSRVLVVDRYRLTEDWQRWDGGLENQSFSKRVQTQTVRAREV